MVSKGSVKNFSPNAISSCSLPQTRLLTAFTLKNPRFRISVRESTKLSANVSWYFPSLW
jgi:hypothetical protein